MRVLLVLIVLLALAGAALWLASGSRAARAPRTEVATPQPQGSATPARALVPAPERPEPVARADAPAAPAREAAATTHEAELARARWITGRVVFPPGTPVDEEAYVRADGRDFGDGSDHRARVEPDGSFRVAFSEKTKNGLLALDARYLLLEKPFPWKRGEASEIVLEPALGGRVTGRLRLPDGVAPGIGGEVQLHREDDPSSWLRKDARPVEETLAFSFDALAPDHGHLVVYDGAELVGASAKLDLEPGRTAALDLELRPGSVLSGVVRDEGGAPLVGVSIEARGAVDVSFWSRPDRERTVETGADGSFRLGALAPGKLRLEAHLAGFEPAARELGQRAEATRIADLVLVLPRGRSIAGTVRWPDGSPAETHLELSPHRQGPRPNPDVSGKSDAHGRFAISGLSADVYRVLARATQTEEVPVKSELTGRERKKKQRTFWKAEVDQVAAGTSDVVLTLSTGLEVAGRVVDDRGVALTDFHVEAERVASASLDDELGKVYRDTDGSFVLPGFTPGEWELRAARQGHAPSLAARVTVPATEPVLLVVPREAIVRGIVLDPGGAPAVNASVRARQDPASHRFWDDDEDDTDARGAFEIGGLRPGTVRLQASGAHGASNAPLAVELVAGATVADLVLRLRPGATIVGELVNADGSPAIGEVVWIHGGGFTERPETDAAGRFEVTGVPPDEITLFAETREGLRVQQRVRVEEGETVRVRLAPPNAGALVRLSGTVRADGAPLADAGVYVTRAENTAGAASTSASTEADAEGAYELTLPGAGEYALTVRAEGEQALSWRGSVAVPDVRAFVFDVTIPIGRISGRVLDPDGRPLAQILVQSEPERHEGAAHGSADALTDAEGRYELVVPAGRHAVKATGYPGWLERSDPYAETRVRDLVVAENAHLRNVDLRLATGGTVEGRVLLADGAAAPLARVSTAEGGYTRASVACDESGRFRLAGLLPGTHLVSARGQNTGASAPATVAVVAGATAEVELVLAPATLVHLLVRDASGTQVGCELALRDEHGRALAFRKGASGEAWLGPLIAGRYTVRAQRDGKQVERVLELDGTREKLELELAFD